MEIDNHSTITLEDEHMELPPGFRFHPTDEELITHYLSEKVLDSSFTTIAIGEADLNKIEPWDLPSQAKMGEKEWYFFVVRDRKYPTGLRTNRATEAGYWKATGKDKEIYRAKVLVGMKKTLVFYTGRAPKGEKTNWVMHEYRLEGRLPNYNNLPKNAKNDWVISRVFKKISGAKKQGFLDVVSLEELQPNFLPPLVDSSPYNSGETMGVDANPSHVTCFSYPHVVGNHQQFKPTKEEDTTNNMFGTLPCSPLFRTYSRTSLSNMLSEPEIPDFQFVDSLFTQDQSMLKLLIEGKGSNEELSGIGMPSSGIPNHDIVNDNNNPNNNGPFDHDCLWDY